MEKGQKKLIIRILSTAAVLAVAIAICTFVAKKTTEQVEASTNILQKVSTKYTSGSSFKILEVVPEHTIHENEEIGYLVKDQNQHKDFMEVSQAKSIGSLLDPDEGISNLLRMRDYGLIKDYGVDYGNQSGFVSDNPVYSDSATFASNAMTGFELAEKQFVAGVYSMANSGNYQMDENKYYIDSTGTINAFLNSVSDNSIPENNYSIGNGALVRTLSVIANTDGVEGTSGEEVSEEEIPVVDEQDAVTVTVEDEEESDSNDGNGESEEDSEETETQSPQEPADTEDQPDGSLLQEMEVDDNPAEGGYGNGSYQWTGATVSSEYEPVEEGDPFNKALPEGITWVGDGTGNVNFTESPVGKYYGYAIRNLYYNTDSNNYFHNGSWFKEFVFGDKDISINISIKTATPGEIAAASINMKDYDLVYISGRNEVYIQKGEDFADSQVMDLYNAVVSSDHQAVIMDYALIDKDAVEDKAALGTLSNLEKLALLLWQKNQTAVLMDTLSENGAGGAANNGFDISTAANGDISMLSFGSVSNIVWHYLATTAPLGGYGNFVAGSVYVYEHRLQFFQSSKAQVDAYDFFGNGDFNSQYVDTVVAAGFSQVEYAVKVNNANNPTEKMSEQITPAVVVQYILSYDGTASSLVKNDLRILEIEPCRDFSFNIGWGTQSYSEIQNSTNLYSSQCCTNREEFIKRYIGAPFVKEDGSIDEQNIDRVRFTSMTIEEFICKNGNVSEEYDIIYIGSNHSPNPAYTTYYSSQGTGNYKVIYAADVQGKSADTPEYITDFRDNMMDGMVYFNIGDIAYFSHKLPNGWGEWDLWGYLDNGREAQTGGQTRFAARDLTSYKMTELLDYLDNGYPIIVAGDMLKTNDSGNRIINPTINTSSSSLTASIDGVDHGRIDNCSVMYEFFQVATGQSTDSESIGSYSASGYDNFISEADALAVAADPVAAADFKEKVIQGVNAAKLSMNVTARPTEYEYTTDVDGTIKSHTSMSAESDGKYYMEFEFTLQNFSTNSTESDIYTPRLYVDVNADGKFSETEELEGAVVTNALTGVEVPHATTSRGNVYELSTNVLYRFRREVPDGFQGVLPWCLKVEKSLSPKVSASETGYSAIKGEASATIRILQVTHNTMSTVDLATDLEIGLQPYGLYGMYIRALNTQKMFNLRITTIKQSQLNEYLDKLNDYDMLVLGFGDNYADTDQAASDALADYVASGKPVLLCHDFLEHYPGYAVVKTLRDVLGMDRYGIRASGALGSYVRKGTGYTKADSGDSAAINAIEGSGRRVAYQPGSNKRILVGETQGLTNYFIMKFYKAKGDMGRDNVTSKSSNPYLALQSPDMYLWSHPPGSNSNQDYLVVIDKVNEGQITNYPYKLPDAFPVNTTHGQYFQPNMEADQDQDGTADITIWYTLGYGHGANIFIETVNSKLSDGVYNISPKDGVNNYYIFNSGNVTYTGSGHSSLVSPANTYETQLFINTLVAAYRAGVKRPTVSIYDGNDLNSSAISNVAVPYDENIGLNASDTNKAESSIIKDRTDSTRYQYPFVSISDANATRVWFRVSDPNLVKGSKKIQLKFWREVPDGTPGAQSITLDNGETAKVIELKMPFYSTDFTQSYAYGTDATGGVMYGLKLPMDLLKTSSDFKIYVEAETKIESVSITGQVNTSISGKSYASLGVTKMDLLKLD
ncbi:MAG: DUF5057 domain-containing protein [Lachnospiraceae bacterium]|nr:DUF5057 domain-containing protein [Lachnospiraceae bacterium]